VCIIICYLFFSFLFYIGLQVAPDSDHLDSEGETPTRKRKASKAALEKQKAAAKKRAKKHDDDDDYEDDEDVYTAPSKSLRTSKSSNPKPPVGSLEKCAKCTKQFAVVSSFWNLCRRSYS